MSISRYQIKDMLKYFKADRRKKAQSIQIALFYKLARPRGIEPRLPP